MSLQVCKGGLPGAITFTADYPKLLFRKLQEMLLCRCVRVGFLETLLLQWIKVISRKLEEIHLCRCVRVGFLETTLVQRITPTLFPENRRRCVSAGV